MPRLRRGGGRCGMRRGLVSLTGVPPSTNEQWPIPAPVDAGGAVSPELRGPALAYDSRVPPVWLSIQGSVGGGGGPVVTTSFLSTDDTVTLGGRERVRGRGFGLRCTASQPSRCCLARGSAKLQPARSPSAPAQSGLDPFATGSSANQEKGFLPISFAFSSSDSPPAKKPEVRDLFLIEPPSAPLGPMTAVLPLKPETSSGTSGIDAPGAPLPTFGMVTCDTPIADWSAFLMSPGAAVAGPAAAAKKTAGSAPAYGKTNGKQHRNEQATWRANETDDCSDVGVHLQQRDAPG
jgi:hypothetical protein